MKAMRLQSNKIQLNRTQLGDFNLCMFLNMFNTAMSLCINLFSFATKYLICGILHDVLLYGYSHPHDPGAFRQLLQIPPISHATMHLSYRHYRVSAIRPFPSFHYQWPSTEPTGPMDPHNWCWCWCVLYHCWFVLCHHL